MKGEYNMVKLFNLLKNIKGYISVESVVVTGVIIGIGVIGILHFQEKANQSVDRSLGGLSNMVNQSTATNQTQMIQLSDLTEGLPK